MSLEDANDFKELLKNHNRLLEIVERLKKLIEREQDMYTPEQLQTVLDGKFRSDEW